MGVIENIQDYFIRSSKEYKDFIKEMTTTSSEIFYRDGERHFSDKEKNFFKIFNKIESEKLQKYTSSKEYLNEMKNYPERTFVDEKDKVRIHSLTEEQLKGYELKDIKEFSLLFTEEQIDSVPDVIESYVLDREDKINLLLDKFPPLIENGIEYTYFIDKDSFLKKHIIQDEFLQEEKSKFEFVLKGNVLQSAIENIKNQVIIDPATLEQKNQYSNHMDGIEFSDLPKYDFPEFSETQLNSVPDIILGIPISDYEKKLILLNNHEPTTSSFFTFSIDQDNKLVSSYLEIDSNMEPFEVKKPVFKEDVIFTEKPEVQIKLDTEKKKEQIPMIDVHQTNKDGHVSFKTFEKILEVGDRINLLTKDGDLYTKGEVKHIFKGEIQLDTDNGIVRAPFNSRIEPLFLNDIQNKKIDIKYGVNEVITLLDISLDQKKIDLHENYFALKNRMNDFTDLLKGNKTSVLPFEKLNEKVEGKLQILESFEGKLFVCISLKKPKLNLETSYIEYGLDQFKLNHEQKELLKKTGELGLVSLTNTITFKESNLWVSVDKELNSVVTQKKEAIQINNIFGTTTTEEQRNKLKSGEGILLDIKGNNYFIIASAASKNSDGLRPFTESKAREFQLIPNKKMEESMEKIQKKSGIKIN